MVSRFSDADGSVEEKFGKGARDGLRKLSIDLKTRSRALIFHAPSRVDGLKERRENIGKDLIEEFEDRDDKLSSRSVQLNKINSTYIHSFTQKFY